MGRFRKVSKNISILKYARKKNKKRERKKNLSCSVILNAHPNFLFLVLHLEIAIVGVLALRIAVRMASILIS